MILPFFLDKKLVLLAPVTLLLIFLNFLVFLGIVKYEKSNKIFTKPAMEVQNSQSYLYAQFVIENKKNYPLWYIKLAEKVYEGDSTALSYMGKKLSMEDSLFYLKALDYPFVGDQLVISNWKTFYKDMKTRREASLQFNFGIHSKKNNLFNSISYQFIHGGFMHLILNMAFLLLFGSFLEPKIGSLKFGLLYLSCGTMASLFFLGLNSIQHISLVGASGAISGIIGAALVLQGKRDIRLLSPVGFFTTPLWVWVIYFWILFDFIALFRAPQGFSSGVAHTSHIGGFLAGLFISLFILHFSNKEYPESMFYRVKSEGLGEKFNV